MLRDVGRQPVEPMHVEAVPAALDIGDRLQLAVPARRRGDDWVGSGRGTSVDLLPATRH
jgi:hypothetical protein